MPGPKAQVAARRAACAVIFRLFAEGEKSPPKAACALVFASRAKRGAGPEGACILPYFDVFCRRQKACPKGRMQGGFTRRVTYATPASIPP